MTSNISYEMTTTSKRTPISESVAVIQIDVHPIGDKPDNTLHLRSRGLLEQQPSTKFLLGQNRAPAPGMKSWFPATFQPGHHLGLPHSPSVKLSWSREVWFNKVITK
jgi:hypothetical protein